MHIEVGAKNRTAALAAIDQAIELAPGRVLYRLDRAYLLLEDGQAAKAAADADFAVDKAPNHVAALDLSARAHARLGHWEVVVERMQVVLQAEGQKPEHWLLIGQAYIGVRAPVLASEAARRALAKAELAAQAHLVLGESLLMLSQLREAEEEFGKAMSADPNLGKAYLRRGEVRLMLNDPGARDDLVKAKGLLPLEASYIDSLLK
jgi:tetratricopeptide (TPR) repeat protein